MPRILNVFAAVSALVKPPNLKTADVSCLDVGNDEKSENLKNT